jgi:mRNA degradation ribonuclease J1/J2
MIDRIKPKVLVPVHTEHPELFRNAAGKVYRPEKGAEKSV